MKVRYLGHAAFKLTSDGGTSLVADPYSPGDKFSYIEIKEPADIVTISHEHWDHNYAAGVKGNPRVIKDAAPTEVKGIKIKGIPTFHDEAKGRERGKNTIFLYDIDGLKVCHLGDLGHMLSSAQLAEMGRVDVLFIPVGGVYTIDAAAATRLADMIGASVTIPMHFKTPKVDLPIAPVDDFLKGKKNVRRVDSEAEFSKAKLPAPPEIVVLKPAM